MHLVTGPAATAAETTPISPFLIVGRLAREKCRGPHVGEPAGRFTRRKLLSGTGKLRARLLERIKRRPLFKMSIVARYVRGFKY